MSSERVPSPEHRHDPPRLDHHESRTRAVIVLTSVMMVAELVVGALTHSLALSADGFHMATHAGALSVSAFAYWFARTQASRSTYTFGTGKVFALGGYSSALILLMVAVLMAASAVERILAPMPVRFEEALPVAVLGLLVNLLSVKLLDVGHAHPHTEAARGDSLGNVDSSSHHVHDHNLRAAYLHVVADALTSVFAIVALLGVRYLGWVFLDPLMALLGSVIIAHWGIGLCRTAGRQLLDASPSTEMLAQVRERIESLGDERVIDLHVWELGPGRRGCIVSLIAPDPRPLDFYRDAVRQVIRVDHLTIEIDRFAGPYSPAPSFIG